MERNKLIQFGGIINVISSIFLMTIITLFSFILIFFFEIDAGFGKNNGLLHSLLSAMISMVLLTFEVFFYFVPGVFQSSKKPMTKRKEKYCRTVSMPAAVVSVLIFIIGVLFCLYTSGELDFYCAIATIPLAILSISIAGPVLTMLGYKKQDKNGQVVDDKNVDCSENIEESNVEDTSDAVSVNENKLIKIGGILKIITFAIGSVFVFAALPLFVLALFSLSVFYIAGVSAFAFFLIHFYLIPGINQISAKAQPLSPQKIQHFKKKSKTAITVLGIACLALIIYLFSINYHMLMGGSFLRSGSSYFAILFGGLGLIFAFFAIGPFVTMLGCNNKKSKIKTTEKDDTPPMF